MTGLYPSTSAHVKPNFFDALLLPAPGRKYKMCPTAWLQVAQPVGRTAKALGDDMCRHIPSVGINRYHILPIAHPAIPLPTCSSEITAPWEARTPDLEANSLTL